jgi:DNA-binding transcriptional ArsR family regulator
MPAQRTVSRPELVKVFRSMTRQLLLFEYAAHETSPSKVAERLGLPLNLVAYHTNVLVRAGFVELVGTRRVRGAVEHTYRTVEGRQITDGEWAALPPKFRRAISRLLVAALSRDAHRALDQGGMDGGTTHLSRSFLQLDADGREELSALLRSTLEAIGGIEAAARERAGRLEPVELQLLAFDGPQRLTS